MIWWLIANIYTDCMAVFLFIYYPSYKHQIYDLNVSIRKELAARNDAVLLCLGLAAVKVTRVHSFYFKLVVISQIIASNLI